VCVCVCVCVCVRKPACMCTPHSRTPCLACVCACVGWAHASPGSEGPRPHRSGVPAGAEWCVELSWVPLWRPLLSGRSCCIPAGGGQAAHCSVGHCYPPASVRGTPVAHVDGAISVCTMGTTILPVPPVGRRAYSLQLKSTHLWAGGLRELPSEAGYHAAGLDSWRQLMVAAPPHLHSTPYILGVLSS
jgi:hypothetical protein